MTRDELESYFEKYAPCGIDEKGIDPQPMICVDDNDEITMCAMFVSPFEILTTFWKLVGEGRFKGIVFGMDLFTRPGQGTEFDDALTIASWWRAERGVRIGVLNYQHEPRIVRPVDWANEFWTFQMKSELLRTCPSSVLGIQV